MSKYCIHHKLLFNGFLDSAGEIGVTLFFVLSGFLITYLLLIESAECESINLKNFYIRRILRIWPLYFLTLLIYLLYSYFSNSLDERYFYTKLLLYLLFLPNIALGLFTQAGFPSQLWSVGSEEQFYLIWPFFIKFLKTKIIYILFGLPIVFLALRIILVQYEKNYVLTENITSIKYWELFKNYIEFFRVDCMAVGGIFAWHIFMKKNLFILSKPTQVIVWLILLSLLFSGFNYPIINHPTYSILFGILIVNFAVNKCLLFTL